jgi:hypothetical protein
MSLKPMESELHAILRSERDKRTATYCATRMGMSAIDVEKALEGRLTWERARTPLEKDQGIGCGTTIHITIEDVRQRIVSELIPWAFPTKSGVRPGYPHTVPGSRTRIYLDFPSEVVARFRALAKDSGLTLEEQLSTAVESFPGAAT